MFCVRRLDVLLAKDLAGLEGFLAVDDTPSRHWRLLEGCLDMTFPNSLEKAVLLRHLRQGLGWGRRPSENQISDGLLMKSCIVTQPVNFCLKNRKLWRKAFAYPVAVNQAVLDAVVQAAGAALPEFDAVGNNEVSTPMRRAGNM